MPVVPLHFTELRRMTGLVGSRDLQPRDVAVFMVLLSHTDPMTSKVEISAQEAGDLIGMQTAHICASIKRLVVGKALQRTYSERTGTYTLHLAGDIVTASKRKAVAKRWLAEGGEDAACSLPSSRPI